MKVPQWVLLYVRVVKPPKLPMKERINPRSSPTPSKPGVLCQPELQKCPMKTHASWIWVGVDQGSFSVGQLRYFEVPAVGGSNERDSGSPTKPQEIRGVPLSGSTIASSPRATFWYSQPTAAPIGFSNPTRSTTPLPSWLLLGNLVHFCLL